MAAPRPRTPFALRPGGDPGQRRHGAHPCRQPGARGLERDRAAPGALRSSGIIPVATSARLAHASTPPGRSSGVTAAVRIGVMSTSPSVNSVCVHVLPWAPTWRGLAGAETARIDAVGDHVGESAVSSKRETGRRARAAVPERRIVIELPSGGVPARPCMGTSQISRSWRQVAKPETFWWRFFFFFGKPRRLRDPTRCLSCLKEIVLIAGSSPSLRP